MTRRGVTLVEALVAGTVATVMLGAVMQIWTMGGRMDSVVSSTAALQAAAVLETALIQDLHQLGQGSDATEVLRVSVDRLAFHRARFEGDQVALRPVCWRREGETGGGFRLTRTERDRAGRSTARRIPDASLLDARFEVLENRATGNRFVRLTYALVGDELKASPRTAPALRYRHVTVGLRTLGGPGNLALTPACRIVLDGPLAP